MKQILRNFSIGMPLIMLIVLSGCTGCNNPFDANKISYADNQIELIFPADSSITRLHVALNIVANTDSGVLQSQTSADNVNTGINNLMQALNSNYNVDVNILSMQSMSSSVQGYAAPANSCMNFFNPLLQSNVSAINADPTHFRDCLFGKAPTDSDLELSLGLNLQYGVNSSSSIAATTAVFTGAYGTHTPVDAGLVATRTDNVAACNVLRTIAGIQDLTIPTPANQKPLVDRTNGSPQVYLFISHTDLAAQLNACLKTSDQEKQVIVSAPSPTPTASPLPATCAVSAPTPTTTPYPALSNVQFPYYTINFEDTMYAKVTLNYSYSQLTNVAGTLYNGTGSVSCYYDVNRALVPGAACTAFSFPTLLPPTVNLTSTASISSTLTALGFVIGTCSTTATTYIQNSDPLQRVVVSCSKTAITPTAQSSATGLANVKGTVGYNIPTPSISGLQCADSYQSTGTVSATFLSQIPTPTFTGLRACTSVTALWKVGTVNLTNRALTWVSAPATNRIYYNPQLNNPVTVNFPQVEAAAFDQTSVTAGGTNGFKYRRPPTAPYSIAGTVTFPAWNNVGWLGFPRCGLIPAGFTLPPPSGGGPTLTNIGAPIDTSFWSNTGTANGGTVFGQSVRNAIQNSTTPSAYQVSFIIPQTDCTWKPGGSPNYENAVAAINSGQPNVAASFSMCNPSEVTQAVTRIGQFISTQYTTGYKVPDTWYYGPDIGYAAVKKSGVWVDVTSSASLSLVGTQQYLNINISDQSFFVDVTEIRLKSLSNRFWGL